MARKALNKKDRQTVYNIKEVTPENIQVIVTLLEANISPKDIWEILKEDFRNNKIIQNAFLDSVTYAGFTTTFKLLVRQGRSPISIYQYIKENDNELFGSLIRNNRIQQKELIEMIKEEPILAIHLSQKCPLKEILKECPKVARYLPEKVKKTKENIGEEVLGETSFWKKDGETIQYFELGKDIKFNGREDYLKLLQAYIKEDKSIPQFCDKFLIEDIEAFSMVVKQFENEDEELKKQIQQVKENAQNKYLLFMKEKLIPDVLAGKITIDGAIKSIPRVNAWDFVNSKNFIEDNEYVEIFQIMINELGLTKFSSKKEVDNNGIEYTLIGNMSIENLIQWFQYSKNPKQTPVKDVQIGIKKILGQERYIEGLKSKDKGIEGIKSSKYVSRLKQYNVEIDINEIIEHLLFENNGKEYKPTEENIQDAIEYLKVTDRYLCRSNVTKPLKAIVIGNLTKEDIERAKEEKNQRDLEEKAKRDLKFSKVANVSSIEEYLNICGNSQNIGKIEDTNKNIGQAENENKDSDENAINVNELSDEELDIFIQDMDKKQKESEKKIEALNERLKKIKRAKELIALNSKLNKEILELESQIQQEGIEIE